jgi:hypothetical protein
MKQVQTNKKHQINRTQVALITATILLGSTFATNGLILDAWAAKCSNPHCFALQRENLSNSGSKYTTIVTNLVPVTPCTDVPTLTQWVSFSNGDYLEEGFTSGKLNTSCYTTERHYYGTDLSGTHIDYDVTSLSVGSVQTFEISDTNKDKYWIIKRNNNSPVAQLLMVASNSIYTDIGEEGNVNSPTSSYIPSTHLYNILRYKGTPISWQIPSSPNWANEDTAYGYWHALCGTPAVTNHFHTGTGAEVACTGTH